MVIIAGAVLLLGVLDLGLACGLLRLLADGRERAVTLVVENPNRPKAARFSAILAARCSS